MMLAFLILAVSIPALVIIWDCRVASTSAWWMASLMGLEAIGRIRLLYASLYSISLLIIGLLIMPLLGRLGHAKNVATCTRRCGVAAVFALAPGVSAIATAVDPSFQAFRVFQLVISSIAFLVGIAIYKKIWATT